MAEIILNAREERMERQKKIIDKYHSPIISFTVNSPGKEKNNEIIQRIFMSGKEEIESMLFSNNISIKEIYISTAKASGPEAIYSVDADAKKIKHLATKIENNHTLGRLFDIDVIDESFNSLSRKELGYKERKCIVCKDDAKICARSQRHEIKEVLKKFNEIYFESLNSESKK
jgi:holo-ACP synthase